MTEIRIDIDQLREDYRLVRYDWRVHGDWGSAELSEADRAIKAAIDSKDTELIACWASWIGGMANDIRALSTRLRAFEEKSKRDAEEARKRNANANGTV